MAKGKTSIFVALFFYVLLVFLDIGLNILAIPFPGLGGLAETFTEGLIEITSFFIVIFIAFIGAK